MENINPPVHQIYLIGPEKQGKSIARRIFPYCERCNWMPAFFISERYTKTIEKDISREGERTGVIAFGRDSEEIYDRLYGEDRQQKILRLLEPGSPDPPFFSAIRHRFLPIRKRSRTSGRLRHGWDSSPI